MSAVKDEKALQALAAVAQLGGFTLASVATSDDFEKRTLTVKFTRVSDGHIQDAFDWDREPVQVATVDGNNGHVDKVETPLQPGDTAETAAQAEAEIAAAQVEQLPEGQFVEGSSAVQEGAATVESPPGTELPIGVTTEISTEPADAPRDPDQLLVGELAAAAKNNRRR